MKLFGTDGVRGEAGSFLSAELAMRVAMATGSISRACPYQKNSRWKRYTQKWLYNRKCDCEWTNGSRIRCSTSGPMPTSHSFLTLNIRCDAGIMISASHSPHEDNGIKFFDAQGNKLSEEIKRKSNQSSMIQPD